MGVVVRLYFLQVLHSPFYTSLARQQYEISLNVLPPRAAIFDRTGLFPLALSKVCQSAFIIPKQAAHNTKLKKFIAHNYPSVHTKLTKQQHKKFLWLDRKISQERAAWLASQSIDGIYFVNEGARFYSTPAATQIVGTVDIDNHGVAGIELVSNRRLGGIAREYIVEKDARSASLYFNKKVINHGLKGQSLGLTIDSKLQEIVFSELESTVKQLDAQQGAAVVMDPTTGEILAMANYPTVDSNNKITSLEGLKNTVVSECYEFGSVMKAFCALAGFEEGVVTPDEIIDCEGRIGYVNGVRVENPTIALLNKLQETNNMLTFADALKYSSNVALAKVATRMGPRLYDNLLKLGFGQKTGIDFPGERAGFLRHPKKWSRPSIVVMSFGYEMMATVLQLAQAFSIIAMDGMSVKPHLEKDYLTPNPERLFKSSSTAQLKQILEKVASKYSVPGLNVWGKTGTARCIVDGKYSNKEHQYSFGGVIEQNNYKRVIVTFIKKPQKSSLWASEVTLPLFASIARRMTVLDAVHNGLVLS